MCHPVFKVNSKWQQCKWSLPQGISALDDFAGVEDGHPDVAGRLGRHDVASLVPDDAAEVVGEVGVVAKVGAHVLRVDGVDDVLYWGRDSMGKVLS